ncbi:MAG: methyltransferase domain-containing protein [Pirellulales bacterium]|nr:methyltransferase domain-containing protein [Pirellulales bacterium]
MFELRCTVRECRESLQFRDNSLFCASGHHFDRAKQGYWNLLQPQDRRSATPGDCDDAVLARHRWLEGGYATGLVAALRPWVLGSSSMANDDPARPSRRIVDLGCGEGWFGPALFADHADQYCGIDLSKRAIKLAARRWPAATWVLANADRVLPVADASVQCVISLFGRRPATEIRRVLAPHGICIVAVPGEDDLIELRQEVQQAGHRRNRRNAIVQELSQQELECVDQKQWQHQVVLDAQAISDALAMTYRAARHSQQSRAHGLANQQVTLAADLILFRRVP